jgi:hypothetical protein
VSLPSAGEGFIIVPFLIRFGITQSLSCPLTRSFNASRRALHLPRLIGSGVILLSARSQSDSGKVLRTAAQTYKVDTEAIASRSPMTASPGRNIGIL